MRDGLLAALASGFPAVHTFKMDLNVLLAASSEGAMRAAERLVFRMHDEVSIKRSFVPAHEVAHAALVRRISVYRAVQAQRRPSLKGRAALAYEKPRLVVDDAVFAKPRPPRCRIWTQRAAEHFTLRSGLPMVYPPTTLGALHI